ncbi:ryncolin-4 [Musca domestica]|uniref:Ryncolin-4 n=1 Tax=Musca domestica TaxID=7370 RepID=A0A1I8NFH8_MUSDO|nr:ryncolin-4 [Musca domestica]
MAIKPAGLIFIWILLSFRSHGIHMVEITSVAQLDRNESVLIFDIHGKLNELEKTVLSSHNKLLETQTNLTNCLNGNPQLNGLLEKLHKLEVGLKEIRANTKKPGDIVIQRRIDGSEDFFRPWADYKKGFGNSSGEFFIGLDKLNKLTNSRPYELLILMEDWENDSRFARYDQFIIGNEAEKYVLKELGKYSGSAGDALGYSLGQKFTTKDQDNDVWNKNCAVEFTGAWWYKDCHRSNLNGRYIKGGNTTVFAQGVDWYPWKGHYYSLKFVEMILRPT